MRRARKSFCAESQMLQMKMVTGVTSILSVRSPVSISELAVWAPNMVSIVNLVKTLYKNSVFSL